MRLIDTATLRLTQVNSGEDVEYAVLSHRWGKDQDELSYREMTETTISEETKQKTGFEKLQRTCEIARTRYALQYAWIDTCCIDKSSSAELSEAINSMFKWYQEARICIAFLGDVTAGATDPTVSDWFTRGWTLQEMIAPRTVEFFSKDWTFMGTKLSFGNLINWKTGISVGILTGEKTLDEFPIAVRMSWASQRRTTRTEDLAYSLLGIFDINMPMLYGEGSKAFLRLQEEIIRQNNDMSIFAWRNMHTNTNGHNFSGLLATSPSDFTGMHNIEPSYHSLTRTPEYSITNQGIRIDSEIFSDTQNGNYVLPLLHQKPLEEPCSNKSLNQASTTLLAKSREDCSNTLTEARTEELEDHSGSSCIASSGMLKRESLGIILRRVGQGHYVRSQPSELTPLEGRVGERSVFHVAKVLTTSQISSILSRRIRIEEPTDLSHADFRLSNVLPADSWASLERTIYVGQTSRFVSCMVFHPTWSDEYDSFVVIFSCEERRFGTMTCLWNFALMEYEKYRQHGSRVLRYGSLLPGLLDDRPLSQGRYCVKRKSIELAHLVEQDDRFNKRVQVACIADRMGLEVKISVEHRIGEDADLL